MDQLELIDGEDKFFNTSKNIKICYRTFGKGIPLFLIAGLELQLIYWPKKLIHLLNGLGYQVVIMDNRDIGRSSAIDAAPPTTLQILTAKTQNNAYEIADMAHDVISLMDHLQIAQAHVIGMSMGGMIAQTIAARYPERVLTLTSIFSTTGEKNKGKSALSTMIKLLSPPAKNAKQYAKNYLSMIRHIGSSTFDMQLELQREYALQAWERGNGTRMASGVARQIGAIFKSGDRTDELKKIKAPTMVIHSDRDLIVDVSGGYATAKAIPQAQLVLIAGMGHFISAEVSPYLVDLIHGHIQRHTLIQAA